MIKRGKSGGVRKVKVGLEEIKEMLEAGKQLYFAVAEWKEYGSLVDCSNIIEITKVYKVIVADVPFQIWKRHRGYTDIDDIIEAEQLKSIEQLIVAIG